MIHRLKKEKVIEMQGNRKYMSYLFRFILQFFFYEVRVQHICFVVQQIISYTEFSDILETQKLYFCFQFEMSSGQQSLKKPPPPFTKAVRKRLKKMKLHNAVNWDSLSTYCQNMRGISINYKAKGSGLNIQSVRCCQYACLPENRQKDLYSFPLF